MQRHNARKRRIQGRWIHRPHNGLVDGIGVTLFRRGDCPTRSVKFKRSTFRLGLRLGAQRKHVMLISDTHQGSRRGASHTDVRRSGR